MQFVWLQSDFAFSRNPMMLRQDMPALKGSEVDGSLILSLGGYKFYEGRVSMPMYINVAEIVDSYVPFLAEPRFLPANGEAPCLELVEDWQVIEDRRRVDAVLSYGSGDDYEAYCYVLKGGISKQNFRQVISLGDDIFSVRFLNPACNFFLTTRSQSWPLVMRETELSPLYFLLSPGESIVISSLLDGEEFAPSGLVSGIYALSVDNLRKWYYDNFGELVNAFDVYKVIQGENVFACRIVVTPVEPSKEWLMLKFRNSLGVMERICLPGVSVNQYSYSPDDAMYQRYDNSVDDFRYERTRLPRAQSIQFTTLVEGAERAGYFMDMVSSEEVYIEGSGLLIRVNPYVEDFAVAATPQAPIPAVLTLELVESESMIMPNVVSGEEFAKGRIHSSQFNNPFN